MNNQNIPSVYICVCVQESKLIDWKQTRRRKKEEEENEHGKTKQHTEKERERSLVSSNLKFYFDGN